MPEAFSIEHGPTIGRDSTVAAWAAWQALEMAQSDEPDAMVRTEIELALAGKA